MLYCVVSAGIGVTIVKEMIVVVEVVIVVVIARAA